MSQWLLTTGIFNFCGSQEMESYIRGLIPNLAQLRNIPPPFLSMYSRIAARKFYFFCDPLRRGVFALTSSLSLCLSLPECYVYDEIISNWWLSHTCWIMVGQPLSWICFYVWGSKLVECRVVVYNLNRSLYHYAGKLCIKKVLLSNCLAELMELHQVSLLWEFSLMKACIFMTSTGFSDMSWLNRWWLRCIRTRFSVLWYG